MGQMVKCTNKGILSVLMGDDVQEGLGKVFELDLKLLISDIQEG